MTKNTLAWCLIIGVNAAAVAFVCYLRPAQLKRNNLIYVDTQSRVLSPQMTNLLHLMWERGFNDGIHFSLKALPSVITEHNKTDGSNDDVIAHRFNQLVEERLSLGEFYSNKDYERWTVSRDELNHLK